MTWFEGAKEAHVNFGDSKPQQGLMLPDGGLKPVFVPVVAQFYKTGTQINHKLGCFVFSLND